MSASIQLKACAYLLSLLGLWSVTATESFAGFWPLLATIVVAASWFYEGPRGRRAAYRRAWVGLSVCMLFFFPIDMAYSHNLLLPAVHISMFAQAYLLLNPKNIGAYRRMFLVSFAQVLASTNLTSGVAFAIILAAYCFTAVYGLMLMQLMRGLEGSDDADLSAGDKAPAQLFFMSVAMAALLFPLTLGFFYSAPRMRYALVAGSRNETAQRLMTRSRARTGFTKTVQLGTFGRIQQDQTLALRVEFPEGADPLRGVRRWRGGALNIYDGTTWSSSRDYFSYFSGRRRMAGNRNSGIISRRGDDIFILDERLADYDSAEKLDADGGLREQIFYLEIPYSDSIFGASRIMAVQGPFKEFGMTMDFNRSFAIRDRGSLPEFLSYTVYSHIRERDVAALKKVPAEAFTGMLENEQFGDYVRTHYLQAPPSLDPEIKRLALEITKDATTPYDKVSAINDYLESQYAYSLDLGAPAADDPLSHFLFVGRKGHCEYFATAMTLMTRLIGIPARLAKGFQKGEWNEAGRYYEVRQRDAHAWIEVYFPGYGWVEFDPSPRAAADDYFERLRSPLARAFAKRILTLQILWRRHVVGYNEIRRLRLFGRIKDIARDTPKTVGGLVGRLTETAWGAIVSQWNVALAAAALVIVIIIGYRKRILFRSLPWPVFRREHANAGAPFYERMLSLLKKGKIIKPAHMTSLEFLDYPPLRKHPMLSDIEAVTTIYYRVRFGGSSLIGEETALINDILRRLKRSNGELHERSVAERSGA